MTTHPSGAVAHADLSRGDTRPARRRRRGPDGYWPWLFVAPLTIGIAVFYLWPLVRSFSFSFTEWGVFGGSTFTGLDNYARMLTDPEVWQSLLNTAIYTAIVLLGIPIAIVISSLIERPGMRFVGLYRTLFFIPYITMPVAIGIAWRIIFNGDFGVINYLLSLVGIQGPQWLATPGFALVAVAIVGLWMSIGFNVIILSAALREVPGDLYAAASLDGAGRLRQLWSITLPSITPSIFFLCVIVIINGFQLFDLLYVMVGPGNVALPSTQSLVYIFYNEAFVQYDRGYAAAIGILILLVVGVLTAIQFRVQRRWVSHD